MCRHVDRVTYYLEVVSSWCHWAEPAWLQLQNRFAGSAQFGWKIALMEISAFPVSSEQCDWFYRRSGMINRSPYMFDSGWFEERRTGYSVPNLVAEAGRDFGIEDDRIRLAIAWAAVREGKKVGHWKIAAEVAAAAVGLPARELHERAQAPATLERVKLTTLEFHALQVTQRPTFVIESSIGDKAVFSGLAVAAPMVATIEAMLHDEAGYAAAQAHLGNPPTR